MSVLSALPLVKIAFGILAGTAIIATSTYYLSKGEAKQQGGTQISQKNNKDTCWEFIDGTDEKGNGSRKLLVCQSV